VIWPLVVTVAVVTVRASEFYFLTYGKARAKASD
jgi:hypothetical protein